jgi:hypothetical protein
MIGAKAQPSNTLLPLVEQMSRVTIRTRATVRRVAHELNGKAGTGAVGRAKGVTFTDESGEEF